MSKKNYALQLAVCGMALALATVIATVIKLPNLPNGGSITLCSMLVITLIGYWYGLKVGLITALAYALLQFITGPYIFHPVQVILDYPLAFGALGLSGIFCNSKHGLVKGYILAVSVRLVVHCISGFIFFTTYVGGFQDNMLAVLGAIQYNCSYIVPEAVLTIIIISVPAVSKALARVRTMVGGVGTLVQDNN